MNLLKKLLLAFAITLSAFIGVVAVYILIALTLSHLTVNADQKKQSSGIEIFVQSNGVHTDFVLPAKTHIIDWTEHLPFNHFENVDTSFKNISFGWGDQGFHINTPTWSDLTFATAFKSIFFLGKGAMHINYHKNQPMERVLCKRLIISDAQYLLLTNYIKASFKVDVNGEFIPIQHPGYSQYDCFYEAHGTFSFLKTCNVWTGKGLRKAGIKTVLWTPFDFSVLNSLED